MEIIHGPSKFDLMVSLFEGNPNPRHGVRFALINQGERRDIPRYNIPVAILAIKQEDGSGESWLFEGYCPAPDWKKKKGTGLVYGYYSSKTRKGFIRSGVDQSFGSTDTREEAIKFHG